MRVLLVEPGKSPVEKEIGGGLEDLQAAVGGYIEVGYPFDDPIALIMNEEGKLDGLPLNRGLYDEDGRLYDIIAGPFLVAGLGEENFTSLTDEQVRAYTEKFKMPEIFIRTKEGIFAIPAPETPPQGFHTKF